jgi:ribose 5-phosphate isomerase A
MGGRVLSMIKTVACAIVFFLSAFCAESIEPVRACDTGIDRAKRAAGYQAVEHVKDGMIVGLGTGSTANFFIEALIAAHKAGLRIQTVASSKRSEELARAGGLPVLTINEVTHIDLTVDGADEIDPQFRMIKGGGGAHIREKILASSSAEMIIIVDESKLVPSLGKGKLPLEIIPYGSAWTQKKIEELGYKGKWRLKEDKTYFITENGNFIFDIQFTTPPELPETVHEALMQIPGVVDTGFFFGLADRVIVGHADGTVTTASLGSGNASKF